ncbi:MAG: HAD-IA family hydrolase [Burkholderiaceae bacterium]
MQQRFDLIVFDWDGTLVDSTATIARCIQYAAADLGLRVPDFERASHVIGLGLHDALASAVPDLPPERVLEFSARYRVHYLARESEVELFAGADELIEALRAVGLRLAIATGKSRAGLARALKAAGLEGAFDATRCADQTHPKPHPAMLLELADELAVDVGRTLMIGDTTHDLQMARAARTHAIGVTYGAHPREQLAAFEPLALLGSLEELRRWLIPT